MNLEQATTQTAGATAALDTEDLISEWSVRVLEFGSRSHRRSAPARREAELVRAYRVRDQLNNRLRCAGTSVATCSDRMARVLAAADRMLLQLTEEADSAAALTVHDHYGKASEWWWKRLLLDQSPIAALDIR